MGELDISWNIVFQLCCNKPLGRAVILKFWGYKSHVHYSTLLPRHVLVSTCIIQNKHKPCWNPKDMWWAKLIHMLSFFHPQYYGLIPCPFFLNPKWSGFYRSHHIQATFLNMYTWRECIVLSSKLYFYLGSLKAILFATLQLHGSQVWKLTCSSGILLRTFSR